MLSLGALSFLNPWLLAGLLSLPILWWLLRAIPPSPKTQAFAGVRLLLGLEDKERQSDKTPWWLLLIRTLAVAAVLIAFAQPVWNRSEQGAGGSGPLLVIMDQGWASAPDWATRQASAREMLEEASEAGREVYFLRGAEGDALTAGNAEAALERLASTDPRPWEPDHAGVLATLEGAEPELGEVIWYHDGLARDGTEDLLDWLADRASVRLITGAGAPNALKPPELVDGRLVTEMLTLSTSDEPVSIVAMAEADAGGERRIAVASTARADDGRHLATFEMPPELVSTVTRVMLLEAPSAGGAAFTDNAVRRASVALVTDLQEDDVATLISSTHYVEKALVPWASTRRGSLVETLATDPTLIIMPDAGEFSETDRETLTEWIEGGGVLLRFAGPRLAASIGAQGLGAARTDDPLLPVRLRRGGRVLGGALAWSTPRELGPFGPDSPFRGLVPPDEVDVRTQVLAEPSPDLAARTWASLDDGTPLVTSSELGEGRVVLFHISSDAEWSSLPLSGLFVEMLGRVVSLAAGKPISEADADELEGTLWQAALLMGLDGSPVPASDSQEPVQGPDLLGGASAAVPPGVYTRTDRGQRRTGEAQSVVVNVMQADSRLEPFPPAPSGVVTETLTASDSQRLGPWLMALAIVLIGLDVLGTLIASDRLRSGAKAAPLMLLLFAMPAGFAEAQDGTEQLDAAAVASAAETTLGFVRTGDSSLDRVSERALIGLGDALLRRTAIEPGPPMGVTPGVDELGFYPVLYWPLTGNTVPERAALDALAEYLRGGGLLIIDTQNGSSGFGGASAIQMREIARALNLPPLAPVDDSHVLSRTFYLLDTFPGRWRGGRIWAEAARAGGSDGVEAEDIPQFDRVDDNVSPVIVGSADWASAWAIDRQGGPMFPIGRPGDRQREMALRFGINAVMYALTGNYKSDQVHAPAVLQRLGQ